MPEEEKHILLSQENMERLGFARFCFPGEAVTKDGIWHRNVGPISDEDYSFEKIDIPESLLVPLSIVKGERLVDRHSFSIKAFGNNILPMKLLCERAGWNQTREDLVNFLDIAKGANFLAQADIDGVQIPLGTGAVYFVGKDICWISMILVHPEVRRQGIARAIMDYCIQYIQSLPETPIIGLDASEMGLGPYESLGFKESSKVWRCKVSTSEKMDVSSSIAIKQVGDLSDCKSYMEKRFADEKIFLYKLLTRTYPATNFIAYSDDEIVGLLFSRPGSRMPFIGPVIANNDEVATALINYILAYWKRKGFSETFMDIPECHFRTAGKITSGKEGTVVFPKNHSFIESANPIRGFVRMYLTDPDTEADKINGYINKENSNILPFIYSIGGPELS